MPPSDHDEYSRLLDWGLRLTFLLAAPAALALAILAVPLITTLFHHGAFTATMSSGPATHWSPTASACSG
jgi:peptidoglycan biosynthesis protein MviN/MurJ (putative lipid II flippase)